MSAPSGIDFARNTLRGFQWDVGAPDVFVEPAAGGAGVFRAGWPFDTCASGCGLNEDIGCVLSVAGTARCLFRPTAPG